MKAILVALALMITATSAMAHSGGTDANGCHLNHKTGVYHCR